MATPVTDDRTIHETMRDLGITVREVAKACGADPSDVSKQLRGVSHLQRRVQRALVEVIDRRAAAALPHTARLLLREGRDEAAEECERVWEELHRPRSTGIASPVDGVDDMDDVQEDPREE